jgi:hypothetical protein
MRAVRRNGNGTGLLAVFGTARLAQGEPRLIEGVELFEDQHRQRLAQIQRRFSHRAEEIALVKFGHADTGVGEIRGGDHARWRESTLQS